MVATADGMLGTSAAFSNRGRFADGRQVGFNLLVIEAEECGCAWLHYKVNNARERWASMA